MPSRDVAICGRFGSRQALPRRRHSTATSVGRRMYWTKDGHPLRMRVGKAAVVRTLLRRGRGWWQDQECAYAKPKSSRTVDVRSSRAKVGRRETADKKWSSKVVDTAGDHQVDIDFGSGGGSFETTERQARLSLDCRHKKAPRTAGRPPQQRVPIRRGDEKRPAHSREEESRGL